jgi:predicted nucleotidyltransferase
MDTNTVLNKALDLIGKDGYLLYLTKFGSHLYGTNGPNSDADYKGFYLPSKL